MRSGLAHNGDIELFWFDEGEIGAPPVVFVNGAGSPSVLWCRELIDLLLGAGSISPHGGHRSVSSASA